MPWKAIEETGKIYGKLTVIKRDIDIKSSSGHSDVRWICKCECGKQITVKKMNLRQGTKCCRECFRSSRLNDLTGKKFGKLTVVEIDLSSRKYFTQWKCRCDCNGNVQSYRADLLRRGDTKSCGCFHREIVSRKPGLAAKQKILSHYKCQARERELEFNLSLEDFVDICSKPCFYCGSLPAQIAVSTINTGKFIYNGIDRVDNSKGYLLQNCVPCCGSCNRLKTDYSQDEFAEKIKAVYCHFVCHN